MSVPYIYMHIWRALFQNAISAIKKNGFKCQSKVCRLCLEKEIFIHVAMRIYLHIYEKVFPKTESLNLVLPLETHFLFKWYLLHKKRALHILIYIVLVYPIRSSNMLLCIVYKCIKCAHSIIYDVSTPYLCIYIF